LLPQLTSARISLPRHDRLLAQIIGLERRTSRSGRDSIDHGPGGHDDLANAVAGAAAQAMQGHAYGRYDVTGAWIDGVPIGASLEERAKAEARWRTEAFWHAALPPRAWY
jgi:hypothetical protein